MSIELTLPYPPSVNHYKNVGRTVITKTGKKYQQRVNSSETIAFYYQVYMLTRSHSSKFFGSATISVEVDVHPPDNRKRDLDGILKVLLDSLQRAKVYDDDYQIACLTVVRKDIIKHGQIIVRINEMTMSPEQIRKKQHAYDCAVYDRDEPMVLGLKERNMPMDANKNQSMPKIEVKTK